MQDINFEETESKIIKTQDENGEIHNFELVDIINFDGQDYGLLVHLDGQEEAEDDEEEEEVVIMRLSKQDEAYTFETIEDDDEFNKVISYIEAEDDECED